MNTQQKDKWNKIRQKGQFRFILSGFFLYGLVITFLSILTDYSFEFFFRDAPKYLHESDRFFYKILFRVVLSSLLGFYISYSLWNKNEKKFFEWDENEKKFFQNPEER
jgi:hypothetical protein